MLTNYCALTAWSLGARVMHDTNRQSSAVGNPMRQRKEWLNSAHPRTARQQWHIHGDAFLALPMNQPIMPLATI
jgi:hypothetical protein